MKKPSSRSLDLCPHCGGVARIINSRAITPLYREVYFDCLTIECGHRWKAETSFVHTIRPSANPRAGLVLPTMPLRGAGSLATNPGGPEVPPRPANDTDGLSAAQA